MSDLPYGRQTMPDGSAVLFSRGYYAMWRRDASGEVSRAAFEKVSVPHDHAGTEYFYTDHTPREERIEAGESALAEWGLL